MAEFIRPDYVRRFLWASGLKQLHVAKVCGIPIQSLSSFVNGRLVLSEAQSKTLAGFVSDYIRRNEIML